MTKVVLIRRFILTICSIAITWVLWWMVRGWFYEVFGEGTPILMVCAFVFGFLIGAIMNKICEPWVTDDKDDL